MYVLNDENIEALKSAAISQFRDEHNKFVDDKLIRFTFSDKCGSAYYVPFHITPVVAGKLWEDGARQKQILNSFASKRGFETYEGSLALHKDVIADDPAIASKLANGGLAALIAESNYKTMKKLKVQALNTNAADLTGSPVFGTAHKYFEDDTLTQSNDLVTSVTGEKVAHWFICGDAPILAVVEREPINIDVVGKGSELQFEYKKIHCGWDQRLLVTPTFFSRIVRSNKAITEDTLNEAIDAFETMKNAAGETLGNVAKYLIVSRSNKAAAVKLIDTMTNAMGASNVMYKKVEVVVVDDLVDVAV